MAEKNMLGHNDAEGRHVLKLTSPIPSPSVAENVKRIWTVGLNHFINLSSPLRC
ncbi:hypothetical protein BJV78DRAFT_1193525 [Lactifluus subvellereus]|nr:hypothetical protein BJV78DRAFT_1193525 [Lactifluus subvellereus]